MNKPFNKFTVGLWALAVIVAAFDCWSIHGDIQNLKTVARPGDTSIVFFFLRGSLSMFVSVSTLGGLGYLIELVDQVRWNNRPPNMP